MRLDAVELRTRRTRAVVVQIRRVVRREMDRCIDAEPVAHPVQESVDLLGRVVPAGDDQVGDLEVAAADLLEELAGMPDGFELAGAHGRVEVAEPLHVDVRRVEKRKDVLHAFVGEIAVGDQDRADLLAAGEDGAVAHVFRPDGGLVERERDAFAAVAEDELNQFFRGIVAVGGVGVELLTRQVAVLAEDAFEVAAVGADGKRLRMGAEMAERFLFDRVDLKRAGVAVGHGIDPAALVEADAAETCASVRDEAVPGTFTKPGEKQTFKFPKVGTLSIEHNSKNTYYVYIDGEKVATWTKAGTYTFDVSAGIEHTVKVVQQDGYLLNPTQGTKKFTVQEGKIISFSGPVSGSSTSYFN